MSKTNEIRSYDYVNHPYEQVRGVLSSNAKDVFRAATTAATDRAESVASELRINVGALEVATEIALEINKVDETPKDGKSPAKTQIELEWESAKAPRLFPLMKGTLSIYPLTATETQLDFVGHYDPPMGPVGNVMNAVAGHRIAEACVHRFIRDTADHLRRNLT